MSLRELVENILEGQKRNLTWLSVEMDKSYTGFKLSLENETIKYSDIKKMLGILNVTSAAIFNEKQTKKFNQLSEPDADYKPERELLREQIEILKNTINDKNKIIELLTKQ